MDKTVNYKIEKSEFPEGNKKWLVVRYSKTPYGQGFGRVFKGTKEECEEYVRKIKEKK